MSVERTPLQSALLLTAFTLSGGSALMLQILWTQKISVFYGVSVHAIATTLAAFMLGLGGGGWLGEQLLRRSRLSGLKLYAISEIVIVLSTLVLQQVFSRAEILSSWFAIHLPGQSLLALGGRFGILAVLFFIPTCAMGASFPFFLRSLFLSGNGVLSSVSTAYGFNVLGAAIGCLLTAQVLLMNLGISNSVLVACLLNILAALIALLVDKRAHSAELKEDQLANEGPEIPAKVLYILIACSGFSAMAFETLWSRMYRQALWLVNPFQAFAQVLSLILFGMAVGALFLRFWPVSRQSLLRLYGWIQFLLVFICIIGITQVRWEISAYIPVDPVYSYRWVTAVIVAAGALLLGMGFPLLSSAYGRIQIHIGRVYAFSSVGGVLGTLVGGFVLMPLLGCRDSLLVLCAGFALCGGVALFIARTASDVSWKRYLILIGCSIGGTVAVSNWTEDRIDFECSGCELLWLNDGLEATTAVVQTRERGPLLYTDGRAIMPGALPRRALTPFLLAPRIEQVLSIGFGSGQLAMMLVQHFPDSQIDCVELDGNMAKTTRFFGTESIFSYPNFQLYIDDGRQHLLRSKGTYDVILADTFTHSINTQIYGAGFFTAAREALSPDGSFFITVPLQDLPSTVEAEIILRTAATSFPYAYVIAPQGMLAILGRTKPLPEDIRDLPSSLRHQLQFTLQRGDVYPVNDSVLAVFSSDRSNTDDRPYFFPLMQRSKPDSGERIRQKIRSWGGLK